jgi:hypothetical protein
MSEQLFILESSRIDGAGIGCFAVSPVVAGDRIAAPVEAGQNRKLQSHQIPDSHLKYCPLLESGLYLAPANFAAMSVIWYINHAKEPNLEARAWQLHAARDIEIGDELTMYYPDLLTHPKNRLWVVPELHV